MRYEERTEILKDGRKCLLRSPQEEDAKEMIEHLIQTSDETGYLARYGEEISITEEQERKYLKETLESSKNIFICAEVDGKVAACAGINPASPYLRHQHRASFGISVKKEYWNLGIASLLLSAILESAVMGFYEQVELAVVADNEKALHIYEKFGFRSYGKLNNAFKYKDGSYSDEYFMLLPLKEGE